MFCGTTSVYDTPDFAQATAGNTFKEDISDFGSKTAEMAMGTTKSSTNATMIDGSQSASYASILLSAYADMKLFLERTAAKDFS